MHGYLSSKESFSYQIKFFSKFRRVIAPDLSGFGKSDKLSFAYSLDDYVLEVYSLLSTLNVTSYDLVAHSFGGRIAIKLASLDKRLDKIILTGSAGLKPKRTLKYYIKVYLYKILKKILPPEKLKNFGSSEYKLLSGYMKDSYVKIVNCHLDNYAKSITNKTLIINGDNDRETPLYMAKKLNKYVKNSSLKIIKNVGHFAFIDDYFTFNLLAKEFLLGE